MVLHKGQYQNMVPLHNNSYSEINYQYRKHYEAGKIFINGSVPTSGVYIINIHVNGCNYEKVVNIQ